MIRIAHLADSHISTKHPRWWSVRTALADMTKQIKEAKPDLIVHAGDLMERNPSADDLYNVSGFIQELGDIAPLVVVRGNHDPDPAIFHVLQRLKADHPMWFSTGPDTIALCRGGLSFGFKHLSDLEGWEMETADLVIHTLPWPTKGRLLSALKEPPPEEDRDQIAGELLKEMIAGMKTEREVAGYEGPSMLLAHLDVHGATLDNGQPSAAPGIKVGADDFNAGEFSAVALGHVHARQQFPYGIYYAGSPCRMNWGEAGTDGKGWVQYELGRDVLTKIAPKDVPSPRLCHIEAQWNGDGWDLSTDSIKELEGAEKDDELRLRYTVDEDQREAAKAKLTDLTDLFKIEVKVEEIVRPQTRTRDAGIVEVEDDVERLSRWIDHEYPDMDPERKEGILDIARRIEP